MILTWLDLRHVSRISRVAQKGEQRGSKELFIGDHIERLKQRHFGKLNSTYYGKLRQPHYSSAAAAVDELTINSSTAAAIYVTEDGLR